MQDGGQKLQDKHLTSLAKPVEGQWFGKIPVLSLIGPPWITCSSLNQSLWPGRWKKLIGQARDTCQPPPEPYLSLID